MRHHKDINMIFKVAHRPDICPYNLDELSRFTPEQISMGGLYAYVSISSKGMFKHEYEIIEKTQEMGFEKVIN